MKTEALLFLIVGLVLCIIGTIYATDWLSVLLWIGGFVIILFSIAIIFPQKKGVSIE